MYAFRLPFKQARSSSSPSSLRATYRSFSVTRHRYYVKGPIGVKAALRAKADPSFTPRPTLFQEEFNLTGRVAVVSGANRGLGLEVAQALAEAGATVHCFDLPATPGETWETSADYIQRLGHPSACLKYASLDVTRQYETWEAIEAVATASGDRLDICMAVAGVIGGASCLDYHEAEFSKILTVNINGAFYFAQGASRQMAKYDNGGSVVLMSSAAGSVATKGTEVIAYSTSKSAVLQVARSMACELGPRRIRVNTLSPGYIRTDMTGQYLDQYPDLEAAWSSQNPLGRLGRPDELRGAVVWLASDASTYCTGSDILVCGGHVAW